MKAYRRASLGAGGSLGYGRTGKALPESWVAVGGNNGPRWDTFVAWVSDEGMNRIVRLMIAPVGTAVVYTEL